MPRSVRGQGRCAHGRHTLASISACFRDARRAVRCAQAVEKARKAVDKAVGQQTSEKERADKVLEKARAQASKVTEAAEKKAAEITDAAGKTAAGVTKQAEGKANGLLKQAQQEEKAAEKLRSGK